MGINCTFKRYEKKYLLNMFESILDTTLNFDFSGAMICTLCSLIFGVIIAFAYKMQDKASKNLLVSLTLLPVIVQVVIMLVNGNLGAGVAIMGAFSLIRLRRWNYQQQRPCDLRQKRRPYPCP